MKRPFNFSPGPATLPEPVLRQAAEEMLSWHGSGMSVMEMSHRGAEFTQIHEQAMVDFRALLGVPDDYAVLFLQGGAIAENAIVPLNLSRGGRVDFIVTGGWSAKSAAEAAKYADVHIAATSQAEHYTHVPAPATWQLRAQAQYLHLCTNETVHGVEYLPPPQSEMSVDLPIVADVSSHVLSRAMDVRRYACLFGGAQKNIGMPGLTFVVVRRDLLGHALPACPSAFDYRLVDENQSMFNTPPTYAIYIAGLVFQWLKGQGGVAAIEQRNIAKAALLYDFIDSSQLYEARVHKAVRSRMNVTFFLRDEQLNERFVAQARSHGLLSIKGHKSAGGMRASLYNAMPLEGVQALVAYMREFERRA
ncbi:MAG: 3-phosphoserine/phosphohydroxythreonine transaminase [Betaproteobacteria bacterium]|nr:3-phosphoserine/phosphohydroxythreonine transaminase [Betaproteobacteria bacterium]